MRLYCFEALARMAAENEIIFRNAEYNRSNEASRKPPTTLRKLRWLLGFAERDMSTPALRRLGSGTLVAGGMLLAGIGNALAGGAGSGIGSVLGRGFYRPGARLMRRGFAMARTAPADHSPPDESGAYQTSDGLSLRWYRWHGVADMPPLVLHHGFAASTHVNWIYPGVIAALRASKRPLIAIDARGHGASDKPHDPALYGEARMAADLRGLLDQLGVERFDLFGYSMGAVVALLVALDEPRLGRLAIGGVGEGVIECGGVDRRLLDPEYIAQALLSEDANAIVHPGALLFRMFAERTGGDRQALAAQLRALHSAPIALGQLRMPTLVLAGRLDRLARRPRRLADAIPDARLVMVPGDHLAAVARPELTAALLEFLDC